MSSVPQKEVLPGVFYIWKLDHRDNTYEKSQWAIDTSEEESCFIEGYTTGIIPKYNKNRDFLYNTCWGLHLENKQVEYLGKTSREMEKIESNTRRDLFIAIFNDNTNQEWHGYPSDPCIKPYEMPPASIRTIWFNKGYFTSLQIKKLVQRKLWKL